jgi:glycosyltransferase involved in cell wall biosynthesis
LKKNKIERVVCNEVRAALTIGSAAKIAGIPLITFVRGDSLIDHYLTNIALGMSDSIICISEGLYELVNGKYKHKAKVINDGIEYFEGKNNYDTDMINIFNAAYITAAKGQLILLEAINVLKDKYRNIKCYFIGAISDDDYYNQLTECIKINKLDEHVIFTGFVDNVNEYFSKGGIYVQPSFTEGLPLSILEAYMLGLPVISSDLPGITPLIKKYNSGIWFEKGNYRELAERISLLIEDSKLAENYGANGKAMVTDEYLIDKTAEKFEEYVMQ